MTDGMMMANMRRRVEKTEEENSALRSELAAVRERVKVLEAVARAYEQWEADMILDQDAWRGGLAELPTLTYPLWDRLLEIQKMRNAALAQPPAGGA